MSLISLLRFIPAVRDLLTENEGLKLDLNSCRRAQEEFVSEKLILEGRLDAALREKDKLWDAMREALGSERTAWQMQINEAWQRRGAGVPFPSAPHPPPETDQDHSPLGRKGRILPSEALARNNARVIGELVDRLNPDR